MRLVCYHYLFSLIALLCFTEFSQKVNASYLQTIEPLSLWDPEADFAPTLVTWNDVIFVNDTAVTVEWTLDTSNSFSPSIPTHFELEIAHGQYTEDFNLHELLTCTHDAEFNNNSFVSNHTIGSLLSTNYYRFRIIPVFTNGRGYGSAALTIATLAPSRNYWEPVMGRRNSLQNIGRGFSNPVMEQPHLSTGVEIREEDTSNNPNRFADPATSDTPKLPSGRRGHSLSPIDQYIYMFGGRTNGYSCASVYKDTLNLGVIESGRYVKPCTFFQGEVWEMWRLDLNTYHWTFLNTTKFLAINTTNNELDDPTDANNTHPAPREQHTAAAVNGDMYIFGGKARFFPEDGNGNPDFTAFHSDEIFGDLWKFSIQQSQDFYQLWRLGPMLIRQDKEVKVDLEVDTDPAVTSTSDGVSNREGLCVEKVVVTVVITHPCINELEIALTGPGPVTGDQNYFPSSAEHRVKLHYQTNSNKTISAIKANKGPGCAGGTHYFIFDDDSMQAVEERAVIQFPYITPGNTFQPDGKLNEFVGASMNSKWELYLADRSGNPLRQGTLDSWDIKFTVSPCRKEYTWTNLTSSVDAAGVPARYGGKAVTHGDQLFIFGGRDKEDVPMMDLYRYDINVDNWTEMVPYSFDKIVLDSTSSVGSNYILSTWGLIRFGGYYRQPTMTTRIPPVPTSVSGMVSCEDTATCGGVDGGAYDNSVYLQDPVTLKWRPLEVYAWPSSLRDSTFGARRPVPRYLSAAAFVSSSTLNWNSKLTHRAFYDEIIESSKSNFQGTISDSIFLFGGFDGSSGVIYDGSSGGYFNDMWMLRLSNLSTPGSRFQQQHYLDRRCRWRVNTAATQGCTSSPTSGMPKCDFKDLMMLAWCAQRNQTMM